MIWTTEKRLDDAKSAAECPTTNVQTAGDAENEETSKCSDKINDAQRAE